MVWPSSFPVCFYILVFLARYLSARRYRQRVYPVTADPTCSFAQPYRLRCLSQLRSARMTFRCLTFRQSAPVPPLLQLSEVYDQVFDSHLSHGLSLPSDESFLHRQNV